LSELVKPVAEWSASAVELVGLVLIAVMAAWALVRGAARLVQTRDGDVVFRETRQRLARGILLGLELLVAADIIHTVAVDLSFQSVGILAIVVGIRTLLSFTLEVDLTGRWPWQHGAAPTD